MAAASEALVVEQIAAFASKARAAIRELYAKLAETSVDVGEKFAEEAPHA